MINFSDNSGIARDKRISKIPDEIPLGILCFNADGIIDYINTAFSRMGTLYHLKTSSLINKNIFSTEIIPGISINEELNSLTEGYPFEKEINNLKVNGHSEISVVIKGSSIIENEKFSGGIIVLEDLRIITIAREDDFLQFESLNKITNKVTDLFFITDYKGFIKYAAGNKLGSFSSTPPSNKNISEIIPQLTPDFNQIIEDVKLKGTERGLITGISIGNENLIYECVVGPLRTGDHPSRFLACTFINITDKVRSGNLEDSLNLFKTVTDFISDGVIGVNGEGIIGLWSPSVHSLTGFSDEETLGKAVWEYLPGFSRQSFIQLKEDLQQIRFFKKHLQIYDRENSKKDIEASFLLGDENNILIVLSSAGKLKQSEFKTAEEYFLNFVTKADEIIIRLNNEGIIEYINPAFTNHLHYKDEEVIGKNINEFTAPDSLLSPDDYSEKPGSREATFLNRNGEKIYFFVNITPLYSDEKLYGFNLYLLNISDQKQKEKHLVLFRFLFESAKDGMAVEQDRRIIAANTAFSRLFGYSNSNEVEGKDFLDLVETRDVFKVAEHLKIYNKTGDFPERLEFSGRRKNGSSFISELTVSSFESEGKHYNVLINRDITLRNKAQQQIRESEEKYRDLLESIDDFLYTLEKGRIFFKPVFYTNSVKKITGYAKEEMLGDLKTLLRIIHPDDFAYVKENLKSLIRNTSKVSAELEFRIINKQGNIVWVRNKLSIVKDNKSETSKIYGLVSDITLRKKAEEELKKSTQNLLKLNDTKDRFISIVSHDLRAPFSSILGFTDLLLNDETLTDEDKNQYIRYIQESSGAMLQLVNSLLDWTRLQTGRVRFEPERITAYEIITRSVNTLKGTALQKNITIYSTVPENIFIYADKNLAGQVFNNLISNAIKFTGEKGSIRISARPSPLSRFFEFSVKDTGVGIAPGDVKKLFGVDTKFSTEGTAGEKGTGLGLSLVKEIIEKHGGTIRVESEQGVGSDFIFTLPVAAANILLVDENTTDRILYSKILKHITPDYEIDTASNGREALEKIFSSTYALIITEHNMQEMGGYELALELKKANMNVKPPIIVLSNIANRQITAEYNEIGVEQVFHKPVNLSIFKQAVEKALKQGLK